MKQSERPPVEPLSERRWQAIEERVLAELERPPLAAGSPVIGRRARIGAAIGVAAAAAALIALAWPRAPDRARDPLATQRFETGDAPARARAGDVTVELAARSALLIVGDAEQGVVAVLERGAARFDVAPRRGRPPFAVEGGEVRVEVVGTRFAVERHGASAAVSVEEGRVLVIARGTRVVLGPGDRWGADDGATAERAAPERMALAVSTGDVGEAGAAAESLGAAPPSAPPRRAERLSPREGSEAVRDDAPAVDVARVTPPEPTLAPSTPPPSAPTPAQRFARAASLESSAPDEAEALYRDLERAGGPWAANALFARGRLALDRGDRPRARSLLQRYLERHPSGANAEDARLLLEQAR